MQRSAGTSPIVNFNSKFRLLCVAAFSLLCALPSNASAATITINGSGLVTGATAVLVSGNLYDVIFSEGSCAQALPYGGCDQTTDFTFQTVVTAQAASQALLDQVFLDLAPAGAANDFDSIPTLTFGCSSAPCLVVTPYADTTGAFYVAAASSNGVSSDSVLALATAINRNLAFSTVADRTLAVWTPHVASVPDEASSVALLAVALVGLVAARRWS